MKQYIIQIQKFGDFGMAYTDRIMVGKKKPQEVYESFKSHLIKEKNNSGYISTKVSENTEAFSNYLSEMARNQKDLSEALFKHLKANGYKEYKSYNIQS